MIVGGYDLHLYCEHETLPHYFGQGSVPKGYHAPSEFPHEFQGGSKAECNAAARKRGWTFRRDGTVVCPRCSRKVSK